MRAAVVIPVRYGSTRFPGKALARCPGGKPLVQYVWEAAVRAEGVERVIVATDDRRIAEAVEAFGGEVRMTSPLHRTGSDRCAEVARDLAHEVVVNLQGDEPGMRPEMISRAVALLEQDTDCVVATLACPIRADSELRDPNAVKVVVDCAGRALYFSRAPIPHVHGATSPPAGGNFPHLLHIGIYAYRRPFLLRFAELPPHPLEEAEKLEQLRALGNGYMIKVGLVSQRTFRVDTPEDLEVFCRMMRVGERD